MTPALEPMPGPSPAPKGVLRISQNVPLDDVIKDARHGLNRVKALLKRGFLGQGTLPRTFTPRSWRRMPVLPPTSNAARLRRAGLRAGAPASLRRARYVPATERAKLSRGA